MSRSMASTSFCYGSEPQHFLEACSMCQQPLAHNRDIFMYRGITAFCSDECRQEQIQIDEDEERLLRRSRRAASAKKTPPVSGATSTAGVKSTSAASVRVV